MDNFSVIGISPFFHKNVLSENMLEKTLDFGFKKELRDAKKGSMMGAYAFWTPLKLELAWCVSMYI